MKWYSMRKVADELGMSVNTFKKHYFEKYPPDRVTTNCKSWTSSSLDRMKQNILKESGAI